MIATVDSPRNPENGSNIMPKTKPTARPVRYLAQISAPPFFNARVPTEKVIWLAEQNRNSAISAMALVLNRASLKPPMRRNS